MSSPVPVQPEEPSLPTLLRSIADQAQEFARAELQLVKVEAKQTVSRASLVFAVVLIAPVLLAIALSLTAAAIVLARGGSAVAALLTAAGVDLLGACIAVILVMGAVRKRSASSAVVGQLTNSPQHGSQTP
jgi:hypothetical protein